VTHCAGFGIRIDVRVAAGREVAPLARQLHVGLAPRRLHRRERLADLVERALLAVGQRPQAVRRFAVLSPCVLDELLLRGGQRHSLEDDLQLGGAGEAHAVRVPARASD
jgi:hypothetical protein